MKVMTEEMKSYFGSNLPFISTVDENGNPNIGPKRSLRILDDNHLIYNENTGKKTLSNIKANGKVSVAIANWGKLDGYRFEGVARVYTEGEFYDNCVNYAMSAKMAQPKAAVVIEIKKIYTLKSEPTAGDEVI